MCSTSLFGGRVRIQSDNHHFYWKPSLMEEAKPPTAQVDLRFCGKFCKKVGKVIRIEKQNIQARLMRRLQRTTSMEQKGRKGQHKVILCNNSCFEIAFQKLLFKDIIFYEVSTKKSKMIQGFINFPILVLSSVDDMKSSEESALDSNTLHQEST